MPSDKVFFVAMVALGVVTVSNGLYGLWKMCWPKPVEK